MVLRRRSDCRRVVVVIVGVGAGVVVAPDVAVCVVVIGAIVVEGG